MKIFNAEQVKAADNYTITHEPISSTNLMERAAGECTHWITNHFSREVAVKVVCGMGNNGGDGLAIARQLNDKGYNTEVFIAPWFSKASPDFSINKERLVGLPSIKVVELKNPDEFTVNNHRPTIIVDAILGSGLSKPVEGELAELIQKINSGGCPIIAIDVPSGLFIEDNAKNNHKNVIMASATLSLELPKLAFMFAENSMHVGDFYILPIGLDQKFIAEQKTPNYFVMRNMVTPMVKPRAKFSHKGTYGHALLIAGSYGKIGAAVLGARACLRSGAGLITVHVPKCGYTVLQADAPEAMLSVDEDEHEFTGIKDSGKYNAIGIGPGIGTDTLTQNAFKVLIQQSQVPLIIDADAINILAENKTWLSFLPKGSILTPHPGEFARLVGKTSSGYDAYTLQREFAVKHAVYVILKGAHTAIATPEGDVYFNSTGNPGMATAGSGDTLTGIITGLLAQGYSPKEAAILGVYLHGLAGDIALHQVGGNSIIAEDITNCLGKAVEELKS